MKEGGNEGGGKIGREREHNERKGRIVPKRLGKDRVRCTGKSNTYWKTGDVSPSGDETDLLFSLDSPSVDPSLSLFFSLSFNDECLCSLLNPALRH